MARFGADANTRTKRRDRRIPWGVVALILVVAGGCGADESTDMRRGRIRIHRVTLLESRGPVDGLHPRFGDWILRSDHIRVLVGGVSRPPDERGALLELHARGGDDDDARVQIAPSVHLGRRRRRVVIDAMRAIERNGRPVLRIAGAIAGETESKVVYTRELALDTESASIGMHARVSVDEGRFAVRLGERGIWGGREVFVPGEGFVADTSFREAGFVAVEGSASSSVFARVDRPMHVGVVFETHGTERLTQFAEMVDDARDLSPERSVTASAILAISEHGMNEALRRVGFLRRAPYPEAHVDLPYAPDESIVRVRTLDGRLAQIARPGPNGHVRVPLPDVPFSTSEYNVAATARGHAGGPSVRIGPGARVALEIPHGGQIRIAARNREGGRPLPGRARFIPMRGAPAVDLGPDSSASGAKDTVLLRDGDAIVPLPSGAYRVLVTHGPEWSMHDETVEVTETFRPDVHAALVHVVDPGDYVGCDLHVHAAPSPDSGVSLDDRVRSLVAEGIEFAVPTDHNHVTDYADSVRAVGGDAAGFLTTPGVEATTWDPAFGHFNAYPVPLDRADPTGGAPNALSTDAHDLFARLHALSPATVVQVNHPRSEGGIGYFDVEAYDARTGLGSPRFSEDFDLLEIWNGFDLARPDTFERGFDDFILMSARGVHVTAVGNSDSHQVRYQWAGYPRTYVHAAARDPAAILAGLRMGRAFITSGPFLEVAIGGHGPGETAQVLGGTAELAVRVRTAPYMRVDRIAIYVGAAKVVDAPIAPPRRRRSARSAPVAELFESTYRVPVERDAAVIVLVSGREPLDEFFGRASIPPLAVANPIWVDADGDGEGPRDPRPNRPRPQVEADAGADATTDGGIDRDR